MTDAPTVLEGMLRLMASLEGVSRSEKAPNNVLIFDTGSAMGEARLAVHTFFAWAIGIAPHVTGTVFSRAQPAEMALVEKGSPFDVSNTLQFFVID